MTILAKWWCVSLVLLLHSADVLLILSSGSGNVNNRMLAFGFQAEALPKGLKTLMSGIYPIRGSTHALWYNPSLIDCVRASYGGFRSHGCPLWQSSLSRVGGATRLLRVNCCLLKFWL